MAHASLMIPSMRLEGRRCTYLVTLDEAASVPELAELARYFSTLGVIGCDVLVLDASHGALFSDHQRILRWVARHVAAKPQHRNVDGSLDPLRAALDLPACEKVIVAGASVRYSPEEIDGLCALLDVHEVIEPQVYLQPLPWWGAIDAGRMLMHRGLEPHSDAASTFAVRRSTVRSLRGLMVGGPASPVRRLLAHGAEVFCAMNLFVRRLPPGFSEWLRRRGSEAGAEFANPLRAAFFFALLPVALLLGLLAGFQLAAAYGFVIACGSVLLAARGRTGAGVVFPARACLFAPLWLLDRSVSVYWALLRRVTDVTVHADGREPVTARSSRVSGFWASGS